MRIERNPPHLVIVPPGSASAPASSFATLLRKPARLSPQEARSLLEQAWTAVVGQAPTRDTALLLTAHWALETDSGRAMPGHNFAGIKASPAASGAQFRTVEGHGAQRREVSARFRVYESAAAGALDYVSLLQARYPAALEAARVGDTTDFARALAAGGYFTADPAAYSSGLRHRRAALEQGASCAALGPPRAVPVALAEAALRGLLNAFHGPSSDP